MNTHLTKKDNSGFTIVELLIVIVVIGILAAIVIVAFNGVQSRANTSAAQSLAGTIAKKAEAYNSIVGQYPTFDQFQNNKSTATSAAANTGPQEARLDNTSQISSAVATATNGKDTVQYVPCSTTGARIHYFDYTLSTPGMTTPTATGNKSLLVGSC